MTESALAPIEQKQVVFYDDEITAVLVRIEGDEKVYVPVKPICDFLGVSWTGQRRRINRDAVLSEEMRSVNVTFTEPSRTRQISMLCLPLEFISGFLFGINPERTKPEIKDKLVRYQRECYQVLADAFMRPGDMTSTPQTAAIMQVREMGRAIVRMADEMLALAERTTTVEARLEKAATVVGNMNKRLTAVEQQVRAGSLTEEQAREIQHRVNLIAREMVKHAPAEKHHMGVYETLRQQTGATSYKAIPPKGYEAAVAFLDQWLESLQQADSQE